MDPTNRNTALASALVEELARCGVRHAAVSPGSRSTPIALALWRHPAIEVTVVLDERSGGFFAVGAAQASGRPTVIACTSGSAAANFHPAVVEADEAGVPLIVLTADRPPELRGIGAGQTIDQLKLYGSSVRWFCDVGTHEADDAGLLHVRSTACRAYAAARGEVRPGAVHLNLSYRDPLAPVPVEGDVTASSELALEGRGSRPLTAVPTSPGRPADALLDELAERIASVPRGLIAVGRQTEPTLAEPVVRLARAAGYPILAEPTSQLRCGSHGLDEVIAPYDLIARDRPAALAPELILRFGDMPTSKPLREWIASLEGARQIVVSASGSWNEPSRVAETMLRADGAVAAAELAERIDIGTDPEFLTAWRTAADAVSDAAVAELTSIGELSEPAVHVALGGLYPEGSLVYTASSMPIRDQEAFLASQPRDIRFLCNRGTNGIDGLISSAAGAARASGRPTYCVTGDLSLAYDMAGLAAARGLETPFRLVVLNNDGGGIFHFLPQAEALEDAEFEALLGTPAGLDLERVATLFGFNHHRVTTAADLTEALAGDRVLVEIPVDRNRNVEIHERLTAAAAQALSSSLSR